MQYLFCQIPIRFSQRCHHPVTLALQRGMKMDFKCRDIRQWQGDQFSEWDSFSSSKGGCSEGGIGLCRKTLWQHLGFHLFWQLMCVSFDLLKKGQIEGKMRTGQRGKKSCVSFYCKSFKGTLSFITAYSPPETICMQISHTYGLSCL